MLDPNYESQISIIRQCKLNHQGLALSCIEQDYTYLESPVSILSAVQGSDIVTKSRPVVFRLLT